MADDVLQIRVVVDPSGVGPGLSAVKSQFNDMAAGLESAGTSGENFGKRVKSGMDAATYSFTEARHAIMGVGEEIGVHLPRFVTTFLAHIGPIGSVMSAAFAPIAVVGLVQVLGQIPDVVDKITNKLIGLTAEEIESYDATRKAIEKRREMVDRIALGVKELSEVGKTGAARELVDTANVNTEIQQKQTRINELAAHMRALKDAQEGVGATAGVIGQLAGIEGGGEEIEKNVRALPPLMKNWDEVGKAIEADKAKIEELNDQVRELQAVKLPRLRLEGAEDARKAADKLAEKQKSQLDEYARYFFAEKAREAEEARRYADDSAAVAREAAVKDAEALTKKVSESAEAQDKIAEIDRRGAEERAAIEADARKAAIVGAGARGGISPEEQTRQLIAVEREKIAIQQRAVDEQMAPMLARVAAGETLDAKELVDWAKLYNEKQMIALKGEAAIQSIQQRSMTQQELQVKKFVDSASAEFSRGLTSWMTGQETFGRAMQGIWTQYATTVISNMIKVTAEMVAESLIHKAVVASEKSDAASIAAAWMFAQVVKIPLVGPFLAEPAAIAAYAAVMAFEKGGIVPETSIAMVHKNEMVLPAHISAQVQAAARGGNAGGSNTFNYRPVINAGGGSRLNETLSKSGRQFLTLATREMRRMNQ